MRVFSCDVCSSPVYFENRQCGRCGSALGFEPSDLSMHALRPHGSDRLCANAEFDACNWLVAADSAERFCAACRHNRTIPDLTVSANLDSWRNFEFAKHRLFYSLIKLGLPLANRTDDPDHGLAFDFLEERNGTTVVTGHRNGIVVLNLNEADDAARARQRLQLGEPYRTLLGHLRHESGHYFQNRLVANSPRHLEAFREVFGDERADYDEALRNYYANGPSPDWPLRLISAYASSHPWEDFAETWAHYLHIEDTMEMARCCGIAPRENEGSDESRFCETVSSWSSLSVVLNSLNRCMGENDLYPFVLAPPAIARLEFVHDLITGSAAHAAAR